MSTSLPKPHLVLRVAVAGARQIGPKLLSEDELQNATQAQKLQDQQDRARAMVAQRSVERRLAAVYECLVTRIQELAPGVPPYPPPPEVAEFYFGSKPVGNRSPVPADYPVLRLLTGLADGGDQLACMALRDFEHKHKRSPEPYTRFERAAILPCNRDDYCANSSIEKKEEFDRCFSECRYVVELDGRCPVKPVYTTANPPTSDQKKELAWINRQRNRAFQAQSTILLRQCDLLIALADPEEPGGVGGTRETMTRALSLGIPVVFLRITDGAAEDSIALIKSPSELERGLNQDTPQWKEALQKTVSDVLADPRFVRPPQDTHGTEAQQYRQRAHEILQRYFCENPMPLEWEEAADKLDCRRTLWKKFQDCFKRTHHSRPQTLLDAPLNVLQPYRDRASEMNARNAAMYRGAFLLNYLLAVIAVFLAVLSLTFVVVYTHFHADSPEAPRATTVDQSPIEREAPPGRKPDIIEVSVLASLGLVKMAALLLIYFNTRSAKRAAWNEKAIDYRYLAERLRTFYYLPLFGCLRGSAPNSGPYRSETLRQSVIDWLFHALIRQIPPELDLQTAHGAAGPVIVRPDPSSALQIIEGHWLARQIQYHHDTARINHRITHWTSHLVERMNLVVILCVAADLAFLTMEAKFPSITTVALLAGAAFLLLAAVIPAAVASTNGVRFQSECQRLAERSRTTRSMLESRRCEAARLLQEISARTRSGDDPGAWIIEALELAEACAEITTDEVAEWSVLYAKEVVET